MLDAALKGFVLALGLILPLGVQNTFVFSQGASHTRWVRALPVVLTAAVCDTLLIVAAVSGVSLVVLQVPWFHTALSWVGVAFLTVIGFTTWRTEPGAGATPEAVDWPVGRQIMFSASLSLFNPHAILDTIGVIGTTSLSFTDSAEKLVYTLACIIVSWLWFLGLSLTGHVLGAVSPNGGWRKILNKVSAVIIWFIGAQLLYGLIWG